MVWRARPPGPESLLCAWVSCVVILGLVALPCSFGSCLSPHPRCEGGPPPFPGSWPAPREPLDTMSTFSPLGPRIHVSPPCPSPREPSPPCSPFGEDCPSEASSPFFPHRWPPLRCAILPKL